MTRNTGKRSKISVFKRRPSTKEQEPVSGNDADDSVEEIVSSMSGMGLGPGPSIRFEDLGISPDVLKGIHAYGLEKPSPIQQRAIPAIKNGRDVILQAQSGMGKTATFCIGILERIIKEKPGFQSLVLAPTRELAEQICDSFIILGRDTKIKILVCIGGFPSIKDKGRLSATHIHIIVGTLGRISSLIKDGYINLLNIEIFAMDEADKMLANSSRKDLVKIVNEIHGDAQIILASATMPPDELALTRLIMRNPIKFLINNEELTLEGIKQFYINVNGDHAKMETLRDLYPVLSKSFVVIFCSTRKKVNWLGSTLLQNNIEIKTMGSMKTQGEREKTLNGLRNGENRVLITTDVIGRGVDVQQLFAVINFDLPYFQVDYIHRVGRGGRFGRKGVAISLVSDKELQELNTIAEFFHTEINELKADCGELFG